MYICIQIYLYAVPRAADPKPIIQVTAALVSGHICVKDSVIYVRSFVCANIVFDSLF